ncbi:sulfotransferase [Actinoallomurus oryzae]|uniref:Sulfotransferase n=1 Tax=Actinoallomurus oryzae TaxID=502180 RepID=A0ABP8QLX9_9ACTN
MTGTRTSVGTIEELHEVASAVTGLSDFGADDYLDGMAVLLDGYATEAALTEQGREWIRAMFLTVLQARLYTEASWREHPEHRHVRPERPIFVTGLPRTGTTALHRLLCADPAHQGLEHWLTETPQPRPPRDRWPSNPGYQRIRAWIDARYAGNPGLRGAHFMAPDMVEECWRIERQSMRSVTFENTAHLPTYSRWLAGQDMTPVYERHRRILQLIGLPDRERRWVLKNPGHLFALDALMTAYPDALIVQTHREPHAILASVSSLNQQASAGHSTVFHGRVVGEDCLALWARGAETFMAARRRHDPRRFADVRYDDFVRDPVATVESIYDRFGLELTGRARTAVEAAHAASRAGERRPAHRYRMSDFGLTDQQITAHFAAYLDDLSRMTAR